MIIDVQEVVAEIGPRFASGKKITIGGRELVGYTRKDGTVFQRWVPRVEAPDTEHDYVEFGEAEPVSAEAREVSVPFAPAAIAQSRKDKARSVGVR